MPPVGGASDAGASDAGAALSGAADTGGAVVAVEPPQAASASVATTPSVKARSPRVSDLTIVSSSKILPE